MSNRRPVLDYPRNEAGLVDDFIGTAYDTVKSVHDNLEEIQRLDGVLGDLPELAENIATEAATQAVVEAMVPVREELDDSVAKAEAWAIGTAPEPDQLSSREWAGEAKETVDAGVVVIEATNAEGKLYLQQSKVEVDQAVIKAEQARDAAMATGKTYATIAAGLAATTTGQYFTVAGSSASGAILTLYQNNSGAALLIGQYPDMATVQQAIELRELLKPNDTPTQYITIRDSEGGLIAYMTATVWDMLSHRMELLDGIFSMQDDEGGVSFHHTAYESILGPLTVRYSDIVGVYITNEDGELLTADAPSDLIESLDPFENGVNWATKIATSDQYPSYIYKPSLINRRQNADDFIMSVGNNANFGDAVSRTGDKLEIQASVQGQNQWLSLAQTDKPDNRLTMNMQLINVPKQTTNPVVNILMIGDSIGNRQGGTFIRKYLSQMGAGVNFIGTIKGTATGTTGGLDNGELGECREGWETGDFTLQVNNRVIVIPVGQEAAYKAMVKNDQWPRNPFLRVATGSDPVEYVRNGHIFDPGFYQSRFGLATPDVVYIGLGTNDVRDLVAGVVGTEYYTNMTIMLKQMRAVWPSAKFILSIPGTSNCSERNELWTTEYSQILRKMRDLPKDLADTNIIIAPAWAMVDHNTGYAFPTTALGEDGFYRGTFTDMVHPLGSTREGFYKALAPFVLAAKLNLI